MNIRQESMSSVVHLGDYCDDCGRPMPLTGSALCLSCEEAERERLTCIVCGGPKRFLDDQTCSDACDATYDEWPEP